MKSVKVLFTFNGESARRNRETLTTVCADWGPMIDSLEPDQRLEVFYTLSADTSYFNLGGIGGRETEESALAKRLKAATRLFYLADSAKLESPVEDAYAGQMALASILDVLKAVKLFLISAAETTVKPDLIHHP